MLCPDFDFDSLWFMVKESKPLIAESIANRAVNVGFSSPEKKNICISDRGRTISGGRKDDPEALAS